MALRQLFFYKPETTSGDSPIHHEKTTRIF